MTFNTEKPLISFRKCDSGAFSVLHTSAIESKVQKHRTSSFKKSQSLKFENILFQNFTIHVIKYTFVSIPVLNKADNN